MKKASVTLLFAISLPSSLAAQWDDPHASFGGEISCTACHIFHVPPNEYPDYGATFESLELCQSCHNPYGVRPVSSHDPAGVDIACNLCHNPHTQEQLHSYGSLFPRLIRTQVDTDLQLGDPQSLRDVQLLGASGPNSFADGDAVYDGICEVCHTSTDHHRQDGSDLTDHHDGADCRSCHPHAAGFHPAGGGADCLGCHDQEQPPTGAYRRQVVEHNGDGLGDFVRASHHVNDGSGAEAVTAADCVVCHDQGGHQGHADPQVLLKDPDGGASILFDGGAPSLTPFCLGCHDADHAGGNAQPFSTPGAPIDIDQGWSNPARHAGSPGAACWDCHQNGHGSDLPHLAVLSEEALCEDCHAGGPAAVDIAAEFAKASAHPIGATSGVHERGEDPLTMARHVECEDCHDPHAANTLLSAAAPALPGGMLGAPGVNGDGVPVAPAANGYEVCYRCHAATNAGSPALPRVEVETDLSVEFDPGHGSFHPIEAVGKNPDVPSLINGWSVGDVMRCEDCHAGDSGVRGPHGSVRPWILKKRYESADGTPESAAAYALCYECHDRSSILDDVSFGSHKRHIQNEESPCSVCHDAHGAGGTHLVNFRTDVVLPNRDGNLDWIDRGSRSGACNLRCHGRNHKNKGY